MASSLQLPVSPAPRLWPLWARLLTTHEHTHKNKSLPKAGTGKGLGTGWERGLPRPQTLRMKGPSLPDSNGQLIRLEQAEVWKREHFTEDTETQHKTSPDSTDNQRSQDLQGAAST